MNNCACTQEKVHRGGEGDLYERCISNDEGGICEIKRASDIFTNAIGEANVKAEQKHCKIECLTAIYPDEKQSYRDHSQQECGDCEEIGCRRTDSD